MHFPSDLALYNSAIQIECFNFHGHTVSLAKFIKNLSPL